MSAITWNPNDKGSSVILSNNNLTADLGAGAKATVRATEGKNSGKWYWEIEVVNGTYNRLGVLSEDGVTNNWLHLQATSVKSEQGFASNQTIGVALDFDSGSVSFYINGAYDNLITLENKSKLFYPVIGRAATAGNGKMKANFGATPFVYPIPEGYKPYDYENASWLSVNKTLILSNNEAYTHNGTEWENIGTPPIDLEERNMFYEAHGMERITADQAKQLKTALPNGKGKISMMKL